MAIPFTGYPANGLPDPQIDADYYEGVISKRFFAWFIDAAVIAVLGIFATLFFGIVTLGIGFFLVFFIFTVTSFVYRTAMLSAYSATLGMKVLGIEFRTLSGEKFGIVEAALHTLGYMMLMSSFIGQAASVITMFGTAYGRSIPDVVLGSTAINRPLQ